MEDLGVINTKSDLMNKTKFKNHLDINCWRIYIELIIYNTGNWLYAYHKLLEAPLELEALGLSLHTLLVNPALVFYKFGGDWWLQVFIRSSSCWATVES